MQERTGGNGEGGGRGINHQDLQMQILKFAQETRRHLADLSVLQVEIYLCNKNNPPADIVPCFYFSTCALGK